MAKYYIPKSVGGKDEEPESELGSYKIPSSVGGDYGVGETLQPKTFDIGLDGGVASVPLQEPEKQPGMMSRMADIATGELRDRDKYAEMGEIGTASGLSTGGLGGDVKVAGGLMFGQNDQAKVDIIKKQFNLPDEAVQTDENGVTVFNFPPSEQYPEGVQKVLNVPGVSLADFQNFIGDMALFYGPGKAGALVKGGLAKTGLGAVAHGAVEYGRQKGAELLGSEQGVSPMDVGMAAVMGGTSEAVPAAYRARQKKKAEIATGIDAGRSKNVEKNLAKAQEIEDVTGLETLRAQKTGSLKDLERQSKLATEFEAGQDVLREQNENATRSVTKFMKDIASAKQQRGSYKKVRTAAMQAIDNLEAVRAKAASPFYQKALNDKRFYSVKNTKSLLRQELKDLPETDEHKTILKNVLDTVTPKTVNGKEVTRGLRMKQLDRAYKMLGKKATTAWKNGDDELYTKLANVRDTLGDEMGQFNNYYAQGREAYKKLSPKVEELQNGIVGDLARLKDQQIKQVRTKLFDKELFEADPDQIIKARKEISAIDPNAWDGIVRSEFKNRIRTKMAMAEGEELFTVENKPGQFYRAIYGTGEKDKAVLYSALNTEQRKRFELLRQGLQRQKIGRPGGSQTDIRGVIEEEFKEGMPNILAKALSPKETAKNAIEQAQINRNKEAAVSLLFDPKWDGDWKKLRLLGANSPKAPEAGRKLWLKALGQFGKGAAGPAFVTQTPEAVGQAWELYQGE